MRFVQHQRRRQWLGLLVLAPLLLAGCGSSNPSAADSANAPIVPVVTAHRENLSSRLSIAAEFEPYQEVNVYAKVSG